MKSELLLRAILTDVLINNFDVANFEKSEVRFDIWLDEKKVQLREDKLTDTIIAYGFGEYPGVKLINDRFHVQQLMSEAVDQMRIRLRW